MEAMTIGFLREKYLSGSLTPQKLMETILENAQKLERMNIWIVEPSEKLIKQYIEKLGPMDFDRKPLWGIPFAIKDNIDLKDVPTTAACPEYSYIPEKSSKVVEKLVEAGAIPIGKTNLDQFATGLVGTRSPYGEVHNSLNEELISGGSSSGSAVAVATGLVTFALGTDTAGSGRVPAALNKLIGYKPSCGLWSLSGVVPACASLDCVTVMATTMEDVTTVSDVVDGYDSEDKWSKKLPLDKETEKKKLIVPKDEPEFYGDFKYQYQDAWHRTIEEFKEKGFIIEEEDCSFYQEAAALLYGGPCVAERWSDLGEFVLEHEEDIFPVTRTILKTGNNDSYTASYLYKTLHELTEYKRRSKVQLSDAILMLPTCAGTYTRDEVRENPIECNNNMGKYTNHCNLLDMCAIDVPGVDADENLPFGVTLFAPSGNDRVLFKAAKKVLGD